MAVPKLRFKEFLGDWSKSTLGNISEIFDGTHQTPKYVDSGVKFVSVENINDLYSTDKYITKDAFDADFKNKPRANDILMTRITAGEIGATAIVKNDEPLGYYVSLALIRPNNYCLSGDLNQYISTNIFKNELHKRIIHTAFPKKINLGDINDCEVSYPSKDEQTKIANFLTAVDEKISQLNEQHQLMLQYKKGVMQKIFSQEIRFKDDNGEEFGEWQNIQIKDIFSVTRGQVLSVSQTLEYKDDIYQYPVYSSQTKNKGLLGYYSDYLYQDAITWTTDGANAGEVNFRKGKFYCTNVCGVLLSNKGYANSCVSEILNSIAKRYVSYVGNPKLMNNVMSEILINIPSDLREQTKISDFLTAIDKRIENLARQLEQAKIWKKGLLQQMFV